MFHEDLGDRMKKYEYVTRNHLIPRMPVIIRVDGKAFHTFTRGFKRPFDDILVNSMHRTMWALCQSVQGCVLGYTQSDEISLVLVDYKKLTSASWFDYNIQKCASIAASMATLEFNKEFSYRRNLWEAELAYEEEDSAIIVRKSVDERQEDAQKSADAKYSTALRNAAASGAMFDARIFNLPREEVCNYLYWRQIDATRNSIQMVGQSQFSHRELQNKSCNEIQEMLFQQRGINWNDYPTHLKRGACCKRFTPPDGQGRPCWSVDLDIPIFKGDGRSYVEDLINFTEANPNEYAASV